MFTGTVHDEAHPSMMLQLMLNGNEQADRKVKENAS